MPKKKKTALEMTTEELAKKVRDELKKVARFCAILGQSQRSSVGRAAVS